MATNQQLVDALRGAAEALLNRPLTRAEFDDLLDRFNRSQAPTVGKQADEAIEGVTGLNEEEIRTKTAASDNTNGILNDLKNTIDDWEPGS